MKAQNCTIYIFTLLIAVTKMLSNATYGREGLFSGSQFEDSVHHGGEVFTEHVIVALAVATGTFCPCSRQKLSSHFSRCGKALRDVTTVLVPTLF